LVRRVAALLARSGRGALRLACRLDCLAQKHEGTVQISVGLFRPTATAEHLWQLVQLQLERLRIPAPVTDIHVTVALSAPLEPHGQATLFDVTEIDSQLRRSRQLAALVERLSSRLGERAVMGVRLRPEAQPELSWHYDPLVERRRRRRAQKALPGELPPRPLRLLPRPVLLAATSLAGTVPIFVSAKMGLSPLTPEGPPLSFELRGQQHKIARRWGPERIETGWWRGRMVGRDYYRVETAAGRRFWLFRRLHDGKWFLHGLFE
jgi:protein ImuB